MAPLRERFERIDGGRMEIWLNIRDLAEKIKTEFKLTPLSDEAVATYASPMVGQLTEPTGMSERLTPQVPQQVKTMSQEIRKEYLLNPRGGLKTPHLHLDGKIYLLDGKAYSAFASKLIEDVKNRMPAAGTIQFNSLLEVSEATIGL